MTTNPKVVFHNTRELYYDDKQGGVPNKDNFTLHNRGRASRHLTTRIANIPLMKPHLNSLFGSALKYQSSKHNWLFFHQHPWILFFLFKKINNEQAWEKQLGCGGFRSYVPMIVESVSQRGQSVPDPLGFLDQMLLEAPGVGDHGVHLCLEFGRQVLGEGLHAGAHRGQTSLQTDLQLLGLLGKLDHEVLRTQGSDVLVHWDGALVEPGAGRQKLTCSICFLWQKVSLSSREQRL